VTRYVVAVLAVLGLGAGLAAQAPSAESARALRFSRVLTRTDYERLLEQPFDVPTGTRRIEVTYRVSGAEARTVVDLGLRGPSGLRGWSGGSRSTVWVSTLGATPGYLPGPIEPGRWAILLGVPNIRLGRTDTVDLTVTFHEHDLADGAAIVGRGPGWFVGDLHSHSGHSDGRARSRQGQMVGTPPHRVIDAAVAAGLDFMALTDHNTASHWLDVDRLQSYYDDILLLHGREVTTYRGHANAIGERSFHEFRLPSPAASPASLLAPIAKGGAFVSINHPALPDSEACMGCGWNVTDADVMRVVHGVEVVNGDTVTGPMSGWAFWSRMLSQGHRLTAVGGSDEHTVADDADRQLGRPATVVWARALSESDVVESLKRGRAYVRVRGPQGPGLEFHAEHGDARVEMGGDTPAGGVLTLVASVSEADGQTLQWVANGAVIAESPVPSSGTLRLEQPAVAGHWFSLVVRDASGPTVYANAIYVRR
jgi:predicted metal-dependent phosphoesterase TrpH